MKKKILSILLCLSMAVCMLAGCSKNGVVTTSGKVDTTSDKVEQVKVTDKLEKKYIERIEAYQDYYEQECQNAEYMVYTRVTVDREGLPLLWLDYSIDGSSSSNIVTQLLTYEDKKVKVLAEVKELTLCPVISSETICAAVWGEDSFYVFDEEKQMFRKTEVPEDSSERMSVSTGKAVVYDYYYLENSKTEEISYIGKRISTDDYDYETLSDVEWEIIEGRQTKSGIQFYCADGSVMPWEEAQKKLNILDNSSEGRVRSGVGGVEWVGGFDAATMFRVLLNQPAYSSEQLFMLLVANQLFFEHSGNTIYFITDSVNLKEYNMLSKASEEYIVDIIEGYFISGVENKASFSKVYFTDELLADKEAVLETEPFKTIKDERFRTDRASYGNNVLTVYSGNGYQFQIEFNKEGDKISKITYIDPTASMSEEEKQEYMVKTEVIPAYKKNVSNADRYTLVYINDDSIPELITSTASWYNFYTYDNDVIALDLSANVFAIIEKENLIHISSGHGTFYDYIGNLKEGAFECLKEGKYGDVYDANGNRVPDAFEYYWEGQQVSEEEYNNSLAQIFDAKKAISSNDLIYYSSIQEAYENIGKTRQPSAVEPKSESAVTEYHDVMYDYTEFSLNANRLKAKTLDGRVSLDMEVSDDCVWQYRGSDGSISESSYEKIYELWETNVLRIQEWLDSKGLDFSVLSDYEFMESQGYGDVLDSPAGLGIEVKDGKVIAVYYTSP